ncbi:MAG TPA: autotransporter domain-containing protein [Oxalicibacterium sp.]|uniref:autotransporter domain-containing protein n=1 Tax=Oxalicibacterium sp. TaxID=2766525 RepID=UPI002D16AF37|nr:autotransporter domain-containing protein [Oxalicibacterium sp.]HWU98741.1 autotransporter domain-containing protein [Oxalicibacterium sp.]
MNTSHRSIWNAALGAWVAVSEITRACGKRSGSVVALAASIACSSVGAQTVIENDDVVTVSGTHGSPWNLGGDLLLSNGTLTVESGGQVSNVRGYIGTFFGHTGNATVTGTGSTWTSSLILFVGNDGTGTLTVSNGGQVSSDRGYIAAGGGSTGNATVTGAGSTWTSAESLYVGQSGTGTLTVSNGGAVRNTLTGFLGGNGSGVGNATVTGAGSMWASEGGLRIGLYGTGTLTVSDGGHVSSGVGGVGLIELAVNPGSTGVLNIGAAVGSAAQAAGTIAGSEVRFGAGTASLNFNHTDTAYTFGTRITGAGTLKHYAGTTILTGANTYTGATTISGGTLSVNGSIANSAVTVNSGGTLGGSGTVGSTSITSGGLLAPGNSIGTLTVNGNLNFAAGSIYRMEVDAAGNNDRTNVTGIATLNGGTVDVQAGAGTYAANTTYTILNAAGGRTGNFAGVTSNLAFLTPTLAYDANNVFLSLARNSTSFSTVAITPNQIATSTALQNANGGATGDMSVVQTALTGLSAEQARAAYDSASGAGLVALRNAGASFAAGLGRQLQARLGAVGGASSTQVGAFAGRPILLAANDSVSDLMAPLSDSPQKFSLASGTALPSASSAQGRGFWLRGRGGYQDTKSDGNATASDLRSTSLSAGFDAEVRDGLVFGAALSSGTARLGFDNTDSGKSRASAIALYGSYASGPWAFQGSASAAWASNQMDRAVMIGAINRTASSDFDSNTLSAYGEATYNLPMNGWTLQPLAGLAFSRNKTDGFTETGAGALNLQVAGQTVNSSQSLLGAKASFEAGNLHLEPRVIWAHEFGDLNTPMTAQFQGAATASPFQVSGVALKRDTLILGLGASGRVGQGVELFVDVQAEYNSAQRNLALLGGLRSRW